MIDKNPNSLADQLADPQDYCIGVILPEFTASKTHLSKEQKYKEKIFMLKFLMTSKYLYEQKQ